MDMSVITTEIFSNINIVIVITLMAIGFIIKHVKFLEKFENSFIPPVLLVLSFIFTFADSGFSIASVFTAIISAAIAVGLHQQGKNIFTVSILPTILSMFSKDEDNNDNEQM